MAEGQITSPILGNFSDLGKMFIDGTARINAIKQEVAKERFALNTALTESIDEIGATNITEWDKVVHSGAQEMRSFVAQAIRDNKAGLISRSDVSSLVSNFQTQAGMLANTTKLYTEKADAIQKKIDAGTESQKALADYNTAWFQDNSMTEYNIKNADGTMRANQKLVQSKIINNQLHFVSTKEILAPKLVDGEEQPDGKGGVIMETKTITQAMPAGSFLDPNIKGAPAFDTEKKVKDFQSTTGARMTFIDINTKQIVDNPFTTTSRQPNGDLVTTSIIAPESFTDMVNLMENRLREITTTTAATIIFDELGGRSLFHDDSPGVRPEDEWKKDFGMFEDKGVNEGRTMPRFFDVNGDKIKLTKDPLVLEMSDDGVSIASPEQVELAKAFMREKYLRSMNITQEQFVNRKKIARAGKTDPPASISPFVLNRVVDGKSKSVKADAEYWENIAVMAQLASIGVDGRGDLATFEAEFTTGGKLNYTDQLNANIIPQALGDILKHPDNIYKTISVAGDMIDLVKGDLTISSINNTPLLNVQNISIVKDPTGAQNMQILVGGDTMYGESRSMNEIVMAGAATQKLDFVSNQEVVRTGVSILSQEQYKGLYKQLYANKQFREVMKSAGFVGEDAYNENINTRGDYGFAFEAYAETIK